MIPPFRIPESPSQAEEGAILPASRRRERATPVGLAISGIVHLLAIALYPLLVGPVPTGTVSLQPSLDDPFQGTEIINLVEVDVELSEPEDPTEPTPLPIPAAPLIELPGDVVGEEVELEGLEARALSAAEVLTPRRGDARLWGDLPEDLVAVPEARIAQLELIWALEDIADSATVAAAAAAAAMDWTYTDGEGNKWGVSPGKLHLGGLTLPLPFSFGAAYDSDAAQRARVDAEIARAAADAEIREHLDERTRAMLERYERARRIRVKPDTIRGGER